MSYQHFAKFSPSKNNHVYSNDKFTMVLFSLIKPCNHKQVALNF